MIPSHCPPFLSLPSYQRSPFKRLLFPLAASLACLLFFAASAASGQTLTRNPQPIQRGDQSSPNLWKGFGFTPHYNWAPILNEPAVADAIYSQLNPVILRIPLEHGWSNGQGRFDRNDSGFKRQVAHLKLAQSKGRSTWYGLHWSPPLEFRKYRHSDRGQVNGDLNPLLPSFEDDYARYIVELVQAFEQAGAPLPFGIGVQNEPGNSGSNWATCKMDAAQLTRLARLFRSHLDAAGYRMNGPKPIRIVHPDSGAIAGGVDSLGGPGFPLLSQLKDDVQILANHSYAGKWSRGIYVDRFRAALDSNGGGRDVWQSEWNDEDLQHDQTAAMLQMGRELGKWAVYVRCNMWFHWIAYYPSWGPSANKHRPDMVFGERPPALGKTFHLFRMLSQQIIPGSYVYSFRSTDPALYDDGLETEDRFVDMMAFEGPGRSVVLLVNLTGSDKQINLRGLSGFGSRADVHRFSASENGAKIRTATIAQGNVEGTLPLSRRSALVLICNGGNGPGLGGPRPDPQPEPEPEPQPQPRAVLDAWRASSPITLDGQLNEPGWGDPIAITKTVDGTTAARAQAAAQWDGPSLYIGATIVDSQRHRDSASPHHDDSLEIYLDANSSGGAPDDTDRQFIITTDGAVWERHARLSGARAVVRTTATGYTVEAAIPLPALSTAATPATLKFDLGVNDDANGGDRDGQLMWAGTRDNWRDTSAFGTLRLQPIPWSQPIYHAEDATLQGTRFEANFPGFTGRGYVDFVQPTGDFIEWTVSVPAAASYRLAFRYALGSTSARPLALAIDGQTQSSPLAFPPTGGWSTWTDQTRILSLAAGQHRIRLTAAGSSGPNLDALSIRPEPQL